jgi:acyl-CoA synthetase (NDP forming)
MLALSLEQSFKLLQKYKIPIVNGYFCKNEKQLLQATKKLSFPIAMKIVSPRILHKTDSGGIKLGLQNEKQLQNAFSQLKKLPGYQGVFVQEMLQGRQIIIGGKRDSQFGPTILFGVGGIFVEIFKDVSVRICPVTLADTREMYKEIKGYAILKGARGEPPINFKELEETLLKVNKLLIKEKISELDINPLFCTPEGKIIAVDARVIK